MQWICQPRNPDSLHQMWFPPKVAAESRGQRDEGGDMDAGGKRPDSHPSLRVATSKHLVMNQLFTTKFSNLSGAWQPDDVPLDASTPGSGSVQSTSVCVCNYSCVRGNQNCHWLVGNPGSGVGVIRESSWNLSNAPDPDPDPESRRYWRKRFPTELFGTIPRSIRRWPSRALPVRSHFS